MTKLLFDTAKSVLEEHMIRDALNGMEHHPIPAEHKAKAIMGIKLDISSAHIVKADNVSKHYNDLISTKRASPNFSEEHGYIPGLEALIISTPFETVSSLPCIAPPFPSLFIEYKLPVKLGDKSFRDSIGVFVSSMEIELTNEGQRKLSTSLSANRNFDINLEQFSAPIKWISHYYCVANLSDDIDELTVIPALWSVFLDEYGKPAFDYGNNMESFYTLADEKGIEEEDKLLLSVVTTAAVLIEIAMLTISFMHCKNVVEIERGHGVERKKKKRRRHRPAHKYHLLKITPNRKVYNEDDDLDDLDDDHEKIKRRLHICRGHFRDYRYGPGLFGKVNKIIWVTPHVRGNMVEGSVEKDYDMEL